MHIYAIFVFEIEYLPSKKIHDPYVHLTGFVNDLLHDSHLDVNNCKDVAVWLEHCVSSSKVVGSIPREHTY